MEDDRVSLRCNFRRLCTANRHWIVLGSSTYFFDVAWQVKEVIDESIGHYSSGKLNRKVEGIFTSAGTMREGLDYLKMLEIALGFYHWMKMDNIFSG